MRRTIKSEGGIKYRTYYALPVLKVLDSINNFFVVITPPPPLPEAAVDFHREIVLSLGLSLGGLPLLYFRKRRLGQRIRPTLKVLESPQTV